MDNYLSILKPPKGSKKTVIRVGRGVGSGLGRTAGRGYKGQGSRAGGKKGAGFEGGQMPLQRRLPKRGFINIFSKKPEIVNLRDLECFKEGTVVDAALLLKEGLVKHIDNGIKVLAKGDLKKKLTVVANYFSKNAKEKIEKSGGKIEIVETKTKKEETKN